MATKKVATLSSSAFARNAGDSKRGRERQRQAKTRDFHDSLPCRHSRLEGLGSQGIEKMPRFQKLSQLSSDTCIIGIPFQASIAAFLIDALHGRPWRNLCSLCPATRLVGEPDELRQVAVIPGPALRLSVHPPAPSRRRNPLRSGDEGLDCLDDVSGRVPCSWEHDKHPMLPPKRLTRNLPPEFDRTSSWGHARRENGSRKRSSAKPSMCHGTRPGWRCACWSGKVQKGRGEGCGYMVQSPTVADI